LSTRAWLVAGWVVAIGVATGVRVWNALAGPLMWGYDAWGHVAYVLFLDLYRAVPWADQGWSYFHPPLHYALGWVLAQAGSAELLMRGLSLLSRAASLGVAGLAAWLARAVHPERPGLALVAFVAVACLPVHYYLSPMPGNELTEALLTAATLCVFVANERRPRPTLLGSVAVGALAGLCLLAKFSGLLVLLVVCACLALRPLLRGAWGCDARAAATRAAVVACVALLLSAPYYGRSVLAFGTPFQLSRDFALVTSVERDQPPGVRSWRDYASFPLRAFREPNPLAPHLLHAVWASVYLNVWADTYRESDVARALEAERGERRSTTWMALLGLLPTGLAGVGGSLALRDAWRGRRRFAYLPLLVQTAASLGAFAVFSWQVPIWSALKASYLLGLSLPFALFLARGLEGLASLPVAWPRRVVPPLLVGVAAAASAVAATGWVLPRRADAPASGAVRFYFGEYDAARRVYGRLIEGSAYPVPWLDNLAAVELADGHPERARRLLARAVSLADASGRGDAYRLGRLALAVALDGDAVEALALFDEAVARAPHPELLANRGAVLAWTGDAKRAEADLRRALEASPSLTPGWLNLAAVLETGGRGEAAARARERAARAACRPPRGYPYGVGTGEVLEWGVARRGLLLLEAQGLRLAPPGFYRRKCA
jgi:tetratricopeptide (TPR) repeat protein